MKKTGLYSVLFVLLIFLSAGGIMVAFVGMFIHPVFIGLGILLSFVAALLTALVSEKAGGFSDKETQSLRNEINVKTNTGANKNNSAYTNKFNSENSTVQPPKDEIARYSALPDVIDENVLVYSYEKNICFFGDGIIYVSGNVGQDLDFMQEPENEYDDKAVAIYLNSNKLGYVYRNDRTQGMINDWISHGEYFTGFLNKYSPANKTATFKIGFYKPLAKFPCKTFSLVKTSKRIDEISKRSDNLSSCCEGESVSVEYDSFDDTFVVYSDTYKEIGELPKIALNFLSGNEYENIVGIIEELEDEFESSPKAKVKIYIVK